MSNSTKEVESVKIVVIDNSDYARKLTVELLESEGFNVVGQAKNSDEAAQYMSRSLANLFIIDLLMPKISGIDLIKMMQEKVMNVHIIMTSSVRSNHLVIDSFSNGAFDFLLKPLKKNDLLKSVLKIKQLIETSD